MTMTLMVLIFVLVWCQVKLEPYQWEEEINVSQAVNFLGNFNKSVSLIANVTDVIYAFPVDETKAMATLRTDGELVAESHIKEEFYIGTVFGTALDMKPVNETGQKQQFDWINQRG